MKKEPCTGSLSSRTQVVAPDVTHCLLAYRGYQEGTVRFRSFRGSAPSRWYVDRWPASATRGSDRIALRPRRGGPFAWLWRQGRSTPEGDAGRVFPLIRPDGWYTGACHMTGVAAAIARPCALAKEVQHVVPGQPNVVCCSRRHSDQPWIDHLTGICASGSYCNLVRHTRRLRRILTSEMWTHSRRS